MTANQKSQNTFKIDVDMVKHVAFLVRLGISDQEAQAFSKQFTSIIDYFHLLNEVDTSQTPSAAQAGGAQSVMREDEIRLSMPREDFLKNVPQREGGFVKVPLVLGEE
jgi:aspartyl-tRNA(Asn)/glutamyl-tRNA(Gln) amidotransferase subunit C